MVDQIHFSPPGPERTGGQVPKQPDDWDISHVSFHDVLSALNPLQYLPVVGTIYRAVTDDSTHPALQIGAAAAGSLLFGGPVGLVATMLGALVTEVAKGDVGTGDAAQQMAAAHIYGHLVRNT